MAADGTRTLVELVREVIGEVAPGELPVVEGLSRLDPDAVHGRLTGSRARGEPLGFGLTEAATLLSPVVWIAVEETVRRMVVSAENGAVKGGAALWRRLRRRRGAELVVPPLSEAQIEQVRARVLELAAEHGVASEDAATLAQSLGRHLTTPSSAPSSTDAVAHMAEPTEIHDARPSPEA